METSNEHLTAWKWQEGTSKRIVVQLPSHILRQVVSRGATGDQISMDEATTSTDSIDSRICKELSSPLIAKDFPHLHIAQELIPLWLQNFGDQFPFLSSEDLQDCKSPWCSNPLLMNSICALSARFSKNEAITLRQASSEAFSLGIIFAEKAKTFIVSSLATPSMQSIAGLLMLAWHELSINSPSACTMFLNMATKMAVQLGLNKIRDASSAGDEKAQLLFWSIYVADRVLAISTGTAVSLRDCDISTNLPPRYRPEGTSSAFFKWLRVMGYSEKIMDLLNRPQRTIEKSPTLDVEDQKTNGEELLRDLWRDHPSPLVLGTPLEASYLASAMEQHVSLCSDIWLYALTILLKQHLLTLEHSVSHTDYEHIRHCLQVCKHFTLIALCTDQRIFQGLPLLTHAWFILGKAELDLTHTFSSSVATSGESSLSSSNNWSSGDVLLNELPRDGEFFRHRLSELGQKWYIATTALERLDVHRASTYGGIRSDKGRGASLEKDISQFFTPPPSMILSSNDVEQSLCVQTIYTTPRELVSTMPYP